MTSSALAESRADRPLVLWAGTVAQGSLLERAEAAPIGGFASMSVTTRDLELWLADTGRTLAQLRRECEARGAPISAVDPYLGWFPGWDPRAASGEAAELLRATEEEVFRYGSELGAPYLTIVGPFDGTEAEFDAMVDSLGRFADRAGEHGIHPHIEPIPQSGVDNLVLARDLVEAVDRPNLGLLIDTYNLARADEDPEVLAAIPAHRIFQLQLADAAAVPLGATYFEDALHHRTLPGDGELEIEPFATAVIRDGFLPPTGPEVFSDVLAARPIAAASRESGEKSRSFLDSLGAPRIVGDYRDRASWT